MSLTTYNLADAVRAMPIALRGTVTTDGDIIDRADTNDSVMFVIISATLTDGTQTCTIKDSDDGTTFAAAAAGDIQGTAVFAATDDDTVKELGYTGRKRYVRLSVTGTGATGGTFGAVAVRAGGRKPIMR